MNRERAKELLPIILAFADGKTIQLRGIYTDGWEDLFTSANFDDNDIEWRIKTEPRVFWIDPAADNDSAFWWLTQEEYDSGQWDCSKDRFIRVIEDLQDE